MRRWVRSAGPAVLGGVLAAVSVAPAAAEPAAGLTTEAATAMVAELQVEVERLRGLDFRRPVRVEVVGPEAVRAHLLERLGEFLEPDELRLTGEAYALLGLLPPGTDLLEQMLRAVEDQVGGFYDPARGAYFLVDPVPPAAAAVYAVHELTHAVEDQHFDLDGRLRERIDDEDRLFALSAVHEGSATVVMMLYTVQATIAGLLDPLALQEVAAAEAENTAQLAELPPMILRQMVAPYVLGAAFLSRGDVLGILSEYPAESARRLYADPPSSSEQILHPDKYWAEALRDEPRAVDLHDAGLLLGRAWRRAAWGTLGELGLGPLVGAPTPLEALDFSVLEPGGWTNAAAAGWDGDRWELWQHGESSVVLWSTAWDSAEDARQFAAALAERTPLRPKVRGERVAVVAGSAGSKRGKLLERMLAAAP